MTSPNRFRAAVLAVALTALMGVAANGALGQDGEGAPDCASRPLPPVPPSLPAAVLFGTLCGSITLYPDGTLSVGPPSSGLPSWVPPGALGTRDGVWWASRGRHIVVLKDGGTIWRSARAYDRLRAYELDGVVGVRSLAFSFRDKLFVSALRGGERMVARRESPLGWTRSGKLFTVREMAPRENGAQMRLQLRSAQGAPLGIEASHATDVRFDRTTGTVVYLSADGRVFRADGLRRRLLIDSKVGFGRVRSFELLEDGMVGVRFLDRVAVLREDGTPFASTAIPRWPMVAGSSDLALDPARRAVAFAVTSGNDGSGSAGVETVLLLREGDLAATVLHRERYDAFGVCERAANLFWHDGWLLYSTSEGRVVVLDSAGGRAPIDLTAFAAELPGAALDEEGKRGLSAEWLTP